MRLEFCSMTDGNAELEKVESRQALPDEPSPLPEDPERYVEAESVLVIKRSTLYYVLFSVILFFGAYIIGWIMGSASGSNAEVIRAAVHEAIATEVSRQSGYPGSIAAAQPAPPTEDPNQRFVVSIAGKPALGPENAPVTMVEFSDFQCPYCGRFFTETDAALLKKYDGKIRFVYRHFPLDSIHPF